MLWRISRKNRVRALRPVCRLHLRLVFGHARILRMDREIDAGVAVAVVIDLDAHLVEELVVRYERQELLDDHGFRRIRRLSLPQVPRRTGGRFVRDHGMHGVVEVLDEHLPVAIMQVAQRRADDLETSRPASGPPCCRSRKVNRRSIRRKVPLALAGARTRSRGAPPLPRAAVSPRDAADPSNPRIRVAAP